MFIKKNTIIEWWNMYSHVFFNCSCFSFSSFPKDSRQKKKEEQRNILDSYQDHGIYKWYDNIEDTVNEISTKLQLKSMKLSAVFILIVTIGIIFGFHLLARADFFFKCVNFKAILLDIIGRCFTAMQSLVLLYYLKRLMIQYEYPKLVMEVLNEPIKSEGTLDVVAWWQIRQYYRHYEIQTFSNVFHLIVGCLLFFTVLCAFYFIGVFILVPSKIVDVVDIGIFIFGIFCLCYVVLRICDTAVNTHKEQLTHATMLEKEIIWAMINYVGDNSEIDIIERIKHEVLKSPPMVILGINMTPTAVVVLRVYFLAALGAVLLEFFFPKD
eukprot:46147_1